MTKNEPNIIFLGGASKEAMRIDKNGVTVNPDLPIDEAAQYVISALNEHINMLVLAEREACANVCDDLYRAWILEEAEDEIEPPDALDCKMVILARGQA